MTSQLAFTCARIGALALAIGFAPASFAVVTASPAEVTFQSPTESKTISLTSNGQPVSAGAIGSVKLMVGKHDYDEMIRVEKSNGAITLHPTDYMEIGSYDLIIRTSHGNAVVKVYTPLEEIPSVVDQRMQEAGISREEARNQLGLTTPAGRERIRWDLPTQRPAGDTLGLSANAAPGRTYVWQVNGTTLQEGAGESVFRYTFSQPGTYKVRYAEMQNGVVVAEWIETFTVGGAPATTATTIPTTPTPDAATAEPLEPR